MKDINEYIESGIIEAYVLGMSTAEETKEMEEYAAVHPEIWDAVNAFSNALEQQTLTNAVAPDPAIKLTLMNFIKLIYNDNGCSFADLQ